jgi:hypothetical protein
MSKDHGHIDYGYGLRDFNRFGINALSGDACGYGGRVLTDLTEEGARLIEEFLGTTIQRGNAWNNGGASIMMPRGIWADLAVFCLIREGWDIVVFRTDYNVIGFHQDDWEELRERYLEVYVGCRVYQNSGTAGTRNRHEFTGRIG